MRKKGDPIHKATSSRILDASLDYEYLKTKNNEFCKEIAELRKDQVKKQADIDYLLREKFNIEFKYNQLYHSFSNIEKRSKICFSHIVECSTELTQIMQFTNKVKSLAYNRFSDSPLETSKTKNTSFRQVVTPHAVNGHVIHTPTIRIARYSEPSIQIDTGCSVNQAVKYNEEDNSSSDDEANQSCEEHINEEDPGNRTFESRSRINFPIRLDLSSLEDDAPQTDNDPQMETNEILSTIQEEVEEPSNGMETENQPVFSGRFQEVRIYLKELSESGVKSDSKRGSNNSSSDLEKSVSSVVPEASTSFDTTTRFNESSHNSTRSSFIQRKSIGSPIPSKISRRDIKNRRVRLSTEMSVPSPTSSPCSPPRMSANSPGLSTSSFSETENTLKYRKSQASEKSTSAGRKSIGSPVTSKITRRSIKNRRMRRSTEMSVPSPTSSPCSPARISANSPRLSTSSFSETENTLKYRKSQASEKSTSEGEMDTSGAVIPGTAKVPTMNSFIKKNSIHSTPLCDSSNTSLSHVILTPLMVKDNIRKNRLNRSVAEPVVQLTRLELSEERTEHSNVRLRKASKALKKGGRSEKLLSNQQIKRENSSDAKKRNVESKGTSTFSSHKVVVSKVKRDKSPDLADAPNANRRPKRNVVPVSLKEPNLNKKMRRSR